MRDYRTLALIVAMLLAGLLFVDLAQAERRFSDRRLLTVPAVANAASYEWEQMPADGPPMFTATPAIDVQADWRLVVQYRVRALPEVGSTDWLTSEWSEWSEPASWWPNPDCDDNDSVGLREFGCFREVFGDWNCGGEWVDGPCP